MERGLASCDIYVIVSECQDLIGCYVEKIYQLSRDEILLKIQQKTKNQKESLFIRNGKLFCRTQMTFDVPEKPSLFAMTLRKYILNGRIRKITQHEFDRIIKITISRKEGDYNLICELFSNGNIILCNPEGKIIRPLIKQEWASRLIKSSENYRPPPSQTNLLSLAEHDFQILLTKSTKDLVRTLATSLNLSGLYAEELCVRASIDKKTKTAEIDQTSVQNLYAELQKMLKGLHQGKNHPVLVKKNGDIIDVLPFPFQSYTGTDFEPTESFSKALELFINVQKPKKTLQNKQQKKTEKLRRQQMQQLQFIEEFKRNIAQKRKEADLIYMNFQTIEKILQQITTLLRQKEKDKEIEIIRRNPIVKQFDPIENDLVLLLSNQKGQLSELPLNFRKSISENVDQKYAESKKLQDKLKGAQEAIVQTEHEMKTMKEPDVIKKKKRHTTEKQWWFERFRWFISTEGNIIIAGRDASSNDLVVKKYLKEGDRYAHADIHGAPSCVIKRKGIHDENLPISEQTLQESCFFAASYSRAWNQFSEASAYWVLPEQVSKTPESGEFVPKGGFIIRGKRNYQRCRLEIAVGRINLDQKETLMGGPVTAVAARAKKGYVILVPGITKKTVIIQQLARTFDVSTEDVEKVLPPGNLTILKTIKGES